VIAIIPVCRPYLPPESLDYATECLETGWIAAGPYIEKFEKGMSEFSGCKYGIACSNGTTALHLAYKAIGIEPGDEIIMPSFCIVSPANMATLCKAIPVFVDSEIKTWNMDANLIEAAITKKTKAIVVVHTYGCPADMDKIRSIALKHKLKVIED
jgi:perosamine synthetase